MPRTGTEDPTKAPALRVTMGAPAAAEATVGAAGGGPPVAALIVALVQELRPPLAMLRNIGHHLAEAPQGDRPSEPRDVLRMLEATLDELGQGVDDVLETCRHCDDLPPLRPAQLAIVDTIDGVVARHRARARERRVGLHVRLDDELPAVMADARRVLQVLSRLVSNAVELTREGSSVTVHVLGLRSTVIVGVEDFGPGVPAAEGRRLFEPDLGTDAGGGPSRSSGMFLCRRLIEAQGGHIGVVSSRGHGSTFWFTLPSASNA